MGLVYADVELINAGDLTLSRRYIIREDNIRRATINVLVSTKSYMLCINESIQEQLQFPVYEKRKAQLANGQIVECDVVSQVELRFKNRRTYCNAIILPGNSDPILGTIPFSDMDVLIHPLKQELIVNPEHPYFAQMKVK